MHRDFVVIACHLSNLQHRDCDRDRYVSRVLTVKQHGTSLIAGDCLFCVEMNVLLRVAGQSHLPSRGYCILHVQGPNVDA